MTKSFVVLIFTLTIRSIGLGQSLNFLVYQEDTLNIYGEPLESLYDLDSTSRPSSFFKNPFCDHFPCYVTFWELYDNKIQLTAIRQCCKSENENVDLVEFFGDKVKDGRLFGDWISEELFCPTGDPRKDSRGIPKYNFHSWLVLFFTHGWCCHQPMLVRSICLVITPTKSEISLMIGAVTNP